MKPASLHYLKTLSNHHRLVHFFTGPPASAMWALGDKIASTIVAQTVGVPTLPWSGSGVLQIRLNLTKEVFFGMIQIRISNPSLYSCSHLDLPRGVKKRISHMAKRTFLHEIPCVQYT